MRAFAVDEFGDQGSVRELPEPAAGSGEVRVRVEAAGLNPADLAMMSGAFKDFMETRFPLIPGLDLTGVVDQVGPGVADFKVGDRVFGGVGKMHVGQGSIAEFATANAATIANRPDSIDAELGAGLPLAGVSALELVQAANLKAGDPVLVVGAAGGIGGFVLQLAAIAGAKPISVARSVHDAYVRSLGAAETIDYETESVFDRVRSMYPNGIAAIIDLAGNKDQINLLAQLVRPGGHAISMRGAVDVDAMAKRGLIGENLMTRVSRDKLERLAELIAAGKLRRPEIATFPLADAAKAYGHLQTGHMEGKVVVVL